MKPSHWQWPAIAAPHPEATPASLGQRLLWMLAIWAASVLALAAVGLLLRLTLRA